MYMSINSLADYLDVSKNTALRLVERGVLPPPIQLGRLKRWDQAEVKQAISATLDAAASGRAASGLSPDDLAEEAVNAITPRRKGR
jgi:excisionase family DNA binding protein